MVLKNTEVKLIHNQWIQFLPSNSLRMLAFARILQLEW